MPDNTNSTSARGFLVAAPSSGAGKTTLTLALLRALRNSGRSVVSAKSGPDYIDPKFHEAASGRPCVNLDAWAMDTGTIRSLAGEQAAGADLLLVEGAMGLFDGAANGSGSAADLAKTLAVPVVLVVDCAKQAQSVAALVFGFQNYRPDIRITGVILNRVGSARHEAMLRTALASLNVTVFGAIPRSSDLTLPERHLGLVQADEHANLEVFLDKAADLCREHFDLAGLENAARELRTVETEGVNFPAPIGRTIAVARDVAFAFSYPHLMRHWQREGAKIVFFSPLNNEAPDRAADAIFLPGGYPELHADILAGADNFRSGILRAANSGVLIYGECGGYMTLGEGLVDAAGRKHEMLGLLPLVTSFKDRKRHLGYRKLTPLGEAPWRRPLAAHEFHYASIVSEGDAERLFAVEDAEGSKRDDMGLRRGNVMGSFAHVISSQ